MSALGRLAALAAPPRCAACAGPASPGPLLCAGCEAELRGAAPLIEPGPPGIALAVSAAPFEGAARDVVHGLKYRRCLGLAEVAAEAMLRACPRKSLEGAVVPVPAAPLRWRWRGFDPAEEIAIALSRRLALPLSDSLRRPQGPRQVGRRRQLRLSDPPQVSLRGQAPRRALLVDDVYTTGATLAACAAALRSAGCERVVGLTLARAR